MQFGGAAVAEAQEAPWYTQGDFAPSRRITTFALSPGFFPPTTTMTKS